MRRSVGPLLHLSSHQAQPACTALLLHTCLRQTFIPPVSSEDHQQPLHARQFTQPATAEENHGEATAQPQDDEDLKLMQAVLSRVGPPHEMREAHRTNDVQRMRFGDLPATTQWMESFVGSGSSGGYSASGYPGPQSGDALYDIPAWLAANVPAHDATPKSPLYHWVSWMNENLPQDQRRLYLALHEHLQHKPRRQAIMSKAQYELARLWDWQHRRVAAGLPVEWTPEEQEAARKAAIAKNDEEAKSLQGTAAAARADANAEALLAAGPTRPLRNSRQADSTAGGRGNALSTLERQAAGVRASVYQAKAAVADAERWILQDPSGSAMLPDMRAAQQTAQGAADQCSAAASAGDVAATEEAAATAERAAGIAHRMAAAIAPHWVGDLMQQEADAAAAAAAAAAEKKGARGLDEAKGSSSNPQTTKDTGLAFFMKKAEHRKEEAEKQRKETVEMFFKQLGLSAKEQRLVESLNVDMETLRQKLNDKKQQGLSSSGKVYELVSMLSAFKSRIDNGKKYMAGGSNNQAVPLLRSLSEARAQQEADQADALSLIGGSERSSTSTSGVHSSSTQSKRLRLGSVELAAQAKAALQRAREARHKAAQEQKKGLVPAEQSSLSKKGEEEAALSWSQLSAFDHKSTLSRMADQRYDRELVVQHKPLADNQALELGSPPPYSPDPLYRAPYRFNLGVRPPTVTLDLVLDYFQVKYQDVLLRRDLTQRVCAQLAPQPHTSSVSLTNAASSFPAATAAAANSNYCADLLTANSGIATNVPGTGSSSSHPLNEASTNSSASSSSSSLHSQAVQPGHWSGRLSQEQVSSLNAEAQELFQAGKATEYMRLMRRLEREGLLNTAELAEHEAAVHLRRRELLVEREVSDAPPAAGVSPQLQDHVLGGLTGKGSAAVGSGYGAARAFNVLEQAQAAWEGTWRAQTGSTGPSYAAWAASMAEAAAAPPTPGAAAGSAGQQQAWPADAVHAWWQGKGCVAPSFEEAHTAWQQYLEMAGSPGNAPCLEDVLNADTELRAARAAAAAAPEDAQAQSRLAAAKEEADAVNAGTASLFRSFLARNGSATIPLPPLPVAAAQDASITGSGIAHNTDSNPFAASANKQRAAGNGRSSPESNIERAWQTLVEQNNALSPLSVQMGGKEGKSGLLSMFKGSLTVPDLLRAHWEHVSRTFLRTNLNWSSAPAWDQLWDLMTALHRHTSKAQASVPSPGSVQQPLRDGSEAAKPQPPPSPYAAAGLSPASRELLKSRLGLNSSTDSSKESSKEGGKEAGAALEQQLGAKQGDTKQQRPSGPSTQQGDAAGPDAGLLPEFLTAAGPAPPVPAEDAAVLSAMEAERMEEERQRQWRAYKKAQKQRAGAEAAQGATWPITQQLSPPYPGARPIVRFQQSIILGPASALTSTQGLADRLAARAASDAIHPATQGLGSPPVLLPDHPSSKRVTMRVQLRELAKEMGLSKRALERIKRVAGKSRYDPGTDDLILVCTMHPNREENRRWCMEVLQQLAADAKLACPS